ncbi:hypothetical protein RJ640_027126 [Escallonia rubra]|uniref:LysM domain-containing protein n=1 Tax=Escallonia rubra TaxID=112253 RepID=A0AA88R3J8_9ASTE|nr:hypothetical protein RJ640_027126 [Escallonia rubra]
MASFLKANAASWCCLFIASLVLVFLSSNSEARILMDEPAGGSRQQPACDEIYVVGEGETLHTISDKCGDILILEQNPHINDHDDVFPGLVIKITPTKSVNLPWLYQEHIETKKKEKKEKKRKPRSVSMATNIVKFRGDALPSSELGHEQQ